jgi:hypothetical protein
MWNEMTGVCFKILSPYLHGGTQENHEKHAMIADL